MVSRDLINSVACDQSNAAHWGLAVLQHQRAAGRPVQGQREQYARCGDCKSRCFATSEGALTWPRAGERTSARMPTPADSLLIERTMARLSPPRQECTCLQSPQAEPQQLL